MRLPSVSHFAYDRNGNRTQVATATGTTDYTYGYGSNQLTGLSGQIPASLSLRSGTYTYDARGRLAQASVGSATTRFGVNGLGQRVSKSGTATTLFAYDEAGHLLGEYDSASHPLQETVWLGNLPVGVLANGGRYYVNPGPLGTSYVITNVQGKKVWSWDPQGFGEESPDQNPAGLGSFVYNLRFPGQYYDAETGLHYNMARDYNPSTGRYVQSDPIGLKGGINPYGYVGGNPANRVDVWGGGRKSM